MAVYDYHRKFLLADEPGQPVAGNEYEPGCRSCDDCPYLCPNPPPPPPSKHHTSTILIVSLCILGAVFLFIFCFAVLRFRSRRRNSALSANDSFREDIINELHGPVIDHPIWYIRTIGLPQSAIDSIEVFRYKKGEALVEGSDCSVCLSEFEEDESLRLLPKCSHAFHVPCIDTWLRSHKNCPVCRAPVTTGGVSEENSEETSSSSSESTEENGVGVDGTGEMRSGAEILSNENGRVRVMSDLVEYRVKVDREMEPVRRSVSMDVSSGYHRAVADVRLER